MIQVKGLTFDPGHHCFFSNMRTVVRCHISEIEEWDIFALCNGFGITGGPKIGYAICETINVASYAQIAEQFARSSNIEINIEKSPVKDLFLERVSEMLYDSKPIIVTLSDDETEYDHTLLITGFDTNQNIVRTVDQYYIDIHTRKATVRWADYELDDFFPKVREIMWEGNISGQDKFTKITLVELLNRHRDMLMLSSKMDTGVSVIYNCLQDVKKSQRLISEKEMTFLLYVIRIRLMFFIDYCTAMLKFDATHSRVFLQEVLELRKYWDMICTRLIIAREAMTWEKIVAFCDCGISLFEKQTLLFSQILCTLSPRQMGKRF